MAEKLTERSPHIRGQELRDFIVWLETVDAEELKRWLADGCWKGQLQETELFRNFLLTEKGIDMRTVKEVPFADRSG